MQFEKLSEQEEIDREVKAESEKRFKIETMR